MYRFLVCTFLLVLLAGCAPAPALGNLLASDHSIPNFDHIAIIVLENNNFGSVVGNPQMPNFNKLAKEYTLLTRYYAVRHPSLPNYLALIGGDTFGIDRDCLDCFIDAPSLPGLIEASGRTWKTYQEGMPEPCFLGNQGRYVQRHNPFVYFDAIRLDRAACEQHVVPFTTLQADIESGSLPDFLFITPNTCNDSHDCSLAVADKWLGSLLSTLTPALEGSGQSYLVVITFDEGQKPAFPNSLFEPGGGRIPLILDSPLVRKEYEDATFYNHYSLLRTVSAAWGLPDLGHAADRNVQLIHAPWEEQPEP